MGKPIVRYEAGQTAYPFESLTGDGTTFEASFAPWSNVSGAEPVVGPYGLLTGGAITATATDNQVSVAGLTAMMPGATGANASTGVLSVSTGTVLASRGLTTDTHRITSITVTSAGALAAVAGVDGTAFSETRGADGGPPFIPAGSIEIGQVRLTSITDAPVAAGEIFTVPGLHVERSDYPVYEIDYATGSVVFAEALPMIHDGGAATKLVYARGSTPLFSPAMYCSDWVPAEASYSVSSVDTYDGPVGSSSSSLGQGSFTAQLKDGITDKILEQAGRELWIEFRPDRDKTVPKMLTQGILGVSRTFPAGGGGFSGSFTVTARVATLDVRE
jgi:hypothetical protein